MEESAGGKCNRRLSGNGSIMNIKMDAYRFVVCRRLLNGCSNHQSLPLLQWRDQQRHHWSLVSASIDKDKGPASGFVFITALIDADKQGWRVIDRHIHPDVPCNNRLCEGFRNPYLFRKWCIFVHMKKIPAVFRGKRYFFFTEPLINDIIGCDYGQKEGDT